MSELLKQIDEINKKDRDICQRVYDFFSPLRERYVTESRYKKIHRKKYFGLIPYYKEDSTYSYEYNQLHIQVLGYNYDKVQVIIKSRILPIQGDIQCVGEFPNYIFEKNDYAIAHEESIVKFIKRFLITAIPKYHKYRAFVNHIQDEEVKINVSNMLEELFESDEYKKMKEDLKDSEKIQEFVNNKIRELE